MIEKITKGDIVWCKCHDRYSITSYHVPCIVSHSKEEDRIIEVRPLKDAMCFHVEKCNFEKISVSAI